MRQGVGNTVASRMKCERFLSPSPSFGDPGVDDRGIGMSIGIVDSAFPRVGSAGIVPSWLCKVTVVLEPMKKVRNLDRKLDRKLLLCARKSLTRNV